MLFETTQISLETGIWLQVPVPVQKVQYNYLRVHLLLPVLKVCTLKKIEGLSERTE